MRRTLDQRALQKRHKRIQILKKDTLRYYRAGADDEITLNENRTAFRRLKLLPRLLRDVSKRDLSTTILGDRIDFPVCIAPCAYQRMACGHGELDTVKAVEKIKTCMVLSTLSTFPLEDVSRSSPDALKWFQLYVWRYRDITVEMIRRAEQDGFKALVITVDLPCPGKRRGDAMACGNSVPPGVRLVHIPDKYKSTPSKIKAEYGGVGGVLDPSLKWDIIKWMRKITKLPIVLKGILSPEDALLAVKHKVDGIIVSNHGGRQLDTVPATAVQRSAISTLRVYAMNTASQNCDNVK
ncbi:2-Hydroxyacid oxidase 1-like [Saccoglossus kowalevskii]